MRFAKDVSWDFKHLGGQFSLHCLIIGSHNLPAKNPIKYMLI